MVCDATKTILCPQQQENSFANGQWWFHPQQMQNPCALKGIKQEYIGT